jgi:hypothetical protein
MFSDDSAMRKRPPVVILLNSVVVFAICLFLLCCAASSLGGDNPFAFIGAFAVIPLSLGLAWLQYRSAVCCRAVETRVLAVIFFVLAGFLLFGILSNGLELLLKAPSTDATPVKPGEAAVILAILAVLAAYFAMSGLLNWKWSKTLQMPVDVDARKGPS